MAYGFATQSGGTLRIESERGVGTTVHLYFPRLEDANGGRPFADAPVASIEASQAKETLRSTGSSSSPARLPGQGRLS
jgi:hypothetical protein